jgi:hypothetical protein
MRNERAPVTCSVLKKSTTHKIRVTHHLNVLVIFHLLRSQNPTPLEGCPPYVRRRFARLVTAETSKLYDSQLT